MIEDRSLPVAVGSYYRALDAGQFEQAAGCFAQDVLYAVPRAGAAAGDPLNVLEGRSALTSYFKQRGKQAYEHRVNVCSTVGNSCLLEGVTEQDGGALRTFVASVQLDEDGLILRYLAFQAPQVIPRR